MQLILRFLEKEPHPLTRIEYYLEKIAAFCRNFAKPGQSNAPPWADAWKDVSAEVASEMNAFRTSIDQPPE